jgi:pSer/pThr/pTyr-binding forkhead associated (FHA) protein
MPEPLLAILKLCALALLYLFFIRVVRAVWAELSPARVAAPAAPARQSKPSRRPRKRSEGSSLLVVEPKQHKGRTYALKDEVTLGRAASCTVPLDDGYASQLHARVFRRDADWLVEDLGSTNGTYVNGRKVTRAQPVRRGDRVKIGATVLEVDL